MQINLTARHFRPTQRLKQYAEKRVHRLQRYYDGIIDCGVILAYEKQTQIAEITIDVYGQRLVAREKSEDIFKSIDSAVDKLERQLKKYKAKLRGISNDKIKALKEEGEKVQSVE